MSANELRVIAPDSKKDREALFDLVAKTFPCTGSYFGARDQWCREHYFKQCNYDWAVTRVGYIGSEMVTHYGVWGYEMRIGSARVLTGGIGAVATHGEFRKRGLMAKTVWASIEAMRAQGYGMSVLFGIENFYHQFGYVRAWNETTYTTNLKDMPQEQPTVRLRSFKPSMREDISALYNEENALATGTAVRPTFLHYGFPDKRLGVLWTDESGTTAGYVIVKLEGARLTHFDSAGDPEERMRILTFLARKHGCQEVHFPYIPFTSRLCKRVRQINHRVEARSQRNGGPMICTVSLVNCLTRMTDEFSRRLQNSFADTWSGNLLIADAREKAMLVIDRGQVSVAPAAETAHSLQGGDQIAQLLIGSEDPRDIIEANGMTLTGDAAKLCDALFPIQHPVLEWPDRF